MSPHAHQHLLYSVSLTVGIRAGEKWHPTMVGISIALMIKDAEHLFLYLLVLCLSSLENYLFNQALCSTALLGFAVVIEL